MDSIADQQTVSTFYALRYYGRLNSRHLTHLDGIAHPLYELQRSALENRIESELAARRLSRVLGMPCYVVFDSLTGYNHVVAGDCLDQWDDDSQRVVFTAEI